MIRAHFASGRRHRHSIESRTAHCLNMIKRPAPGDTEQDILKMQSDFLNEQFKDRSFQPAAKVVRVASTTAREPSNFAKKRAAMRLNQRAAEAVDLVDPLLPPAPKPASQAASTSSATYSPIIGNIVERNTRGVGFVQRRADSSDDQGFPKPQRLQRTGLGEGTATRSLFALARARNEGNSSAAVDEPMDGTKMPTAAAAAAAPTTSSFGDKSYILKSSLASEIHAENVKQLSQLNEQQLLDERRQLMDSIDPDIVRFLQAKRQQPQPVVAIVEETPPAAQSDSSESTDAPSTVDNPDTLDILNDPNYAQWPNFDVIEPAKLEWMRDVQARLPDLKPGEAFEARFDWKGVLLPYVLPTTTANENSDAAPMDDRDLYLHGDDAQRPGYTLQELFRLARSKIMQQRISALGAIGGLLSIYNQGFYDSVLDVPVSKCFFLLRFALDENVPAIVECSAKALATLLHNDADETLLDFTRDCSQDFREPIHVVAAAAPGGPAASTAAANAEDVERKFAQLHLSKKRQMKQATMRTSLEADAEEEASEQRERESLNDFHLAEIDLVECLLRTNIVKRINYILFTLRPENSTVLSCLKLLIRLARSGEAVAETLFADDLLRNVFHTFLPHLGRASAAVVGRFYGRPQYMAMKLVRCVAAYGREWCDRMLQWGLWEVLKSYVFVRDDIKIELIKLQIEAFRLAKVVIMSHMQSPLYSELTSALLYMLEWCYQFLQFERTGHLIFRQHAAALVTLIGSMGAHAATVPFVDKLQLCASKWFHQAATTAGLAEFSQHILLAATLNACARISGDGFHAFYVQYLGGFLRSDAGAALFSALPAQSPLLRRIARRPNAHEALPHLNSVVVVAVGGRAQAPDYVLTQQYGAHLVASIVNLLATLRTAQQHRLVGVLVEALWHSGGLQAYVEQLAGVGEWNAEMRGNWFVRSELAMLGQLMQTPALRADRLSAAVVLQIAFRVATGLAVDQVEDVIQLFDAVLFDAAHLGDALAAPQDLDQFKNVYMSLCFEHVPTGDESGLMVAHHRQPALAANWPCAPMLHMLQHIMQPVGGGGGGRGPPATIGWPDADLIRTAFVYIDALHAHGVRFMSPTEHLMTLMIAYLGPACAFLQPATGDLMAASVQRFFDQHRETRFDFEATQVAGGTTFENLYLLLIDHFAGTSYGDAAFGALVMVPLAQRYAVRWRQLVWSEHMAVMRFVRTPVERLLGGGLDAYVRPREEDVTQLKYYYQAQQQMRFAGGSVAERIVRHHLEAAAEARRLARRPAGAGLVE